MFSLRFLFPATLRHRHCLVNEQSNHVGNLVNLIRHITIPNVLFAKRYPPKIEEKEKPSKIPKVTADLKAAAGVEFAELPIVIVKATSNNTLVYLTDHKGVMATWTSAGIEGFKNAKRGTNYAGKVAGEGMAQRANNMGVSRIRLKIKGLGPGRQEAVKGLIAGGMDIVSITDTTPIPHNGPRPKKQRRL